MGSRRVVLLALCIACSGSFIEPRREASAPAIAGGYRTPPAPVAELVTAAPPPEPLVHARSGHVALLFREGVIDLDRLARPRLGLAGFRFDPQTRTSGIGPLVTRVEVIDVGMPAGAPVEWRPSDGTLLDHVHFSPDGRTLSALVVDDGPARLALFDVERGRERVLPTPVNAAWGDPCVWIATDALLCRLVPEGLGPAPPQSLEPVLLEHRGGPVPTRTYANLLHDDRDDALFEHYFSAEVARVDLAGRARRVVGLRGLIDDVAPSPDGTFAVVTRVQRPFPRLVPARQFPSVLEVWDLARAERVFASEPSGFGIDEKGRETPLRPTWKPGEPTTLGWVERAPGGRGWRWLARSEPFVGAATVDVARSDDPIRALGWTTAGTPYFTTATPDGLGVRIHVVSERGAELRWERVTADRFGDPGRVLRADGHEGPVLEVDDRLFVAGDGLGPGGPQPFLEAFDLDTQETERLFTAEPGVFEVVLGITDPQVPVLITSRETANEAPNLFLRRGDSRTALRPFENPFPGLDGATRRVLVYSRSDGVELSGTLYLPASRREGERLPTLVWIYPHEFADREHAEQIDERAFRFHRVKGPSPLAAVVAGYAVLLNPTVPILAEGEAMNDDYLPQLVASAEAAADHLVALGVSDPARIAVGGRSYGAFSSTNLLIHSRRFATAVAMSGAYNRTLTPFGFQHEKRSFWDATDLYTSISPFFAADRVRAPLLLVHGGADENSGTPPLQARRFFHALAGEGADVRLVELPHEGHHYWARESVLHAAAEMIDWLDRTIGPGAGSR